MASTDENWPPQSPHQALLSSPSGRRKYQQNSTHRTFGSKSNPGTPSLLEKLRAARAGQDHMNKQDVNEVEEDEETLQLELAAIEAKLKLKKLQQNKARQDENTKPWSSQNLLTRSETFPSRLEVPSSPNKRAVPLLEPRSPGRFILGIDKGLKPADVSLRRAKTVSSSPAKERRSPITTNTSVGMARVANRLGQSECLRTGHQVKSFSERMADMRQTDALKEEKADMINRSRTRTFQLDREELAKHRAAAALERSSSNSGLDRNKIGLSRSQFPDLTTEASEITPDDTEPPKKARAKPDPNLFERFSGLRLSTRILPITFLERTLPREKFTVYRIPQLLKCVHSPNYEIPDNVTDYVVCGVIASKLNPRDQKPRPAEEHSHGSNDWEKKWNDGSQNQKKFMRFTITDLKWTVDLYLFDRAVPRYHRLNPGTVVAILNPNIMPPRKGQKDTGLFSLALNSGDDQVLEIGTAKHLGYCKAMKRDGGACGAWVNAAKTEICEFHLNGQIAKTQAKRMGVNSGSNGFGQMDRQTRIMQEYDAATGYKKTFSRRAGPGYDIESGGYYYIAQSNPNRQAPKNGGGSGSAPVFNAERSTARMLDADDSDPFIAEGQLSRDKGARMQKRLAAQEKEREIARKLGQHGSGGGAEYMRQHTDNSATSTASQSTAQRSLYSNELTNRKQDILESSDGGTATEIGRKRAADSIRLSPVKKTRFLTDRGIKEAGRESLGMTGRSGVHPANHDTNDDNADDDDDDLDIV